MADTNRKTVERFYHELWNAWDLSVADEILVENVRFRGTLGSTLEGLAAFKGYVETVRRPSPTGTTASTRLSPAATGSSRG